MTYEIPYQAAAELPSEAPEDTKKVSSVAEIHTGRKLIVAGFIIAIAGIIAYCLAGFTDFGQELSTPGKVGLAMIAAGTACWLIGAIKYFHGAVEADLPEELFF